MESADLGWVDSRVDVEEERKREWQGRGRGSGGWATPKERYELWMLWTTGRAETRALETLSRLEGRHFQNPALLQAIDITYF